MLKKIVAVTIVLSILLCMTQTFAYLSYNVGPVVYEMENKYISTMENASKSGTGLSFSSNGSVTYDFYLPFNAVSVDVTYSADAETVLSVCTEEKTTEKVLTPGTYVKCSIPFEITERKGERIMTFSVTSACVVANIRFNNELIETVNAELIFCDLTKNEAAIQSAVLLDVNAGMVMVNGGKRYINNENPKELAEIFDGRVYLPAQTMAKIFGLYIEDMPSRDYLLLRSDKLELMFCNDFSYLERFGHEKENIENIIVYKNGKTYLPLRYFGELLGKTVGYKDGIVAIDDKFSVSNILNDNGVFEYVREQFADFYPEASAGRTYYVAQTANADDNNHGTLTAPFATITGAGKVAKAGDTVIVKEGVYREKVTVANNGEPTSPIIFKAENENTVISTAEELGGFTVDDERTTAAGMTVYKAKLPDDWEDLGVGRNQIFFNGKSMVEARYPNGPAIETGDQKEALCSLWPVWGGLVPSDDDYKMITSDTLLNQEPGHWVGATVVAMRGHEYTLDSATVVESGNGYLKVDDVSAYYWEISKTNVNKHWTPYAYLSGHINALDTYEEWIIKDGYLYFIPSKDSDITDLKVEIKSRQLVADLSDNAYVKFKGFTTMGGSIKMNNSVMCTLDGMNMKYLNHYVKSKDQHSGFIDDAVPTNPKGAPARGEVGIYIGGENNVVINNTFDTAAAAAIYGVGSYTYIENNIVKDCGYAGSYVAGLYFTGEAWRDKTDKRGGNYICRNTVYNSGRAVLQYTSPIGEKMWPQLPSEIAFNDFHDGMLTSVDTGVVYEYMVLMGSEKLFTKMHHNLVYSTSKQTSPESRGIYHDGGAENIDTYSNVTFSVEPNTGFTIAGVYNQAAAHAVAYCPAWNNSHLSRSISGGKENLRPEDFPNQKPFYAGADTDEEYLVNFDALNNPTELSMYFADEATLSDGVELNAGAAVLDTAGDYIKFSDVDFGEKGSAEFIIEFYGDKFNTGDIVEIIVGGELGDSTNKVYKCTLTATAPDKDDVNIFTTCVEDILRGSSNVYIKTTAPKSAQILSLKTGEAETELLELNSKRVYGGRFTDYRLGSGQLLVPQSSYSAPDDVVNPVVNNTRNGNTLIYEDVKFDSAATKLTLMSCYWYTPPTLSAEVRIDDLNSTPIGTIPIEYTGNGYYNYKENTIDISEVSEGVHTVYLTFRGGADDTSNLYWFSFGN